MVVSQGFSAGTLVFWVWNCSLYCSTLSIISAPSSHRCCPLCFPVTPYYPSLYLGACSNKWDKLCLMTLLSLAWASNHTWASPSWVVMPITGGFMVYGGINIRTFRIANHTIILYHILSQPGTLLLLLFHHVPFQSSLHTSLSHNHQVQATQESVRIWYTMLISTLGPCLFLPCLSSSKALNVLKLGISGEEGVVSICKVLAVQAWRLEFRSLKPV